MEKGYNGGTMNRHEYRQALREWRNVELPEPTGPNRAHRRGAMWAHGARDQRRNLGGRGRWRRALTADSGRYDFPFATRLDG